MNQRSWTLFLVTLLLIGGAAGLLARTKSIQKLGSPGVKTRPLPDSRNVEVLLPERVLDYESELLEQPKLVVDTLPPDTSYGQRMYFVPDQTVTNKFQTAVNVVLMGSDRTSIHKPQYCLAGAGWTIDAAASGREIIPITRPHPYDLPVIRLVVSRQVDHQGTPQTLRGVYVYWFVADGELSGDPTGSDRMWSMAKTLVTTGVLQRWAYVTYFSVCLPGEEAATFERMKKMIAAAVPEFQLTPGPKAQAAATQP